MYETLELGIEMTTQRPVCIHESIDWDSYLANTLSVSEEFVHTIPVYDRNTNLSVHLNSTHPSPATLNSMTWEGDYNSKFYQRV